MTQRSRAPVTPARGSPYWGRASVVAALVGIGLSYGTYDRMRASHVRVVTSDFERAAVERARAIEGALRHSLQMLAATGAYLDSVPTPTRAQFAGFSRRLMERRPGVQALSWIARVPDAERDRFEARVRQEIDSFELRELGAGGALLPAGRRSEYFPVVYIEPESGNRRALGYDLGSHAVRRRALERAHATGEATATGRLRLVQETGEQFGFLLVQPLYRRDAGPGTASPRRQTPGFVTQVVRAGDLVERALEILEPAGIDLRLLDESAESKDRFLYFHSSRARDAPPPVSESRGEPSASLARVLSFEMAGRRWQVVASAAPGRFSLAAPWQAWTVPLAGLAFSALFVAYLQLLRRQASRQQRERERLELRVAERTKELERAHQDLVRKERLAALGQLTGTVAHEIRNPLSTISMCFEVLRQKVEAPGAEVERALDRAQRNIGRCARIITELLDFTRARGLDLVPTRLDNWLGSLLDEYSAPNGAAIVRRFGTGSLMAELDPHLLRRAVVNLLDNACQSFNEVKRHSAPGSEANGPEVRIETRSRAGQVQIEISDNGPGIPDQLQDEIFEPLFSTKSFGVGLGLPTVRQIVEQHGGELVLDSKPGRGTRAILTLPQTGAGSGEACR